MEREHPPADDDRDDELPEHLSEDDDDLDDLDKALADSFPASDPPAP